MLLVRHSAPAVDRAVASADWPLSPEGRGRCAPLAERLAPYAPRALFSSPEPKARETAALLAPALGLEVEVADGLRETARRTVGWLEPAELERGVRALFVRPDEIAFGEESAASALARFEGAVRDFPEPSVVVTHGTVLSLYVAARTGRDPYEIWRALQLPDLVLL